MIRYLTMLLLVLSSTATVSWATVSVGLHGSLTSMERQNRVAAEGGLGFSATVEDIDRRVASGELVRLAGNEHYDVLDGLVSNAARPEMRLFVERLAEQYYEATGEKLVVTSLTRPSSMQPHNASKLSVHPTGIAVDLRVSQRAASRQWLENLLLWMEANHLLDITREHRPPHYHIALFPEAYLSHVEGLIGSDELELALDRPSVPEEPFALLAMTVEEEEHVVTEERKTESRPRFSLWRLIVSLFR
ncbi:MAG: DUF5715 family protein [Rhodothermales bacterium]